MVRVDRILIVATSRELLGDTAVKTGVWAEELAAPYYVFKSHGYMVDIASIRGGKVPIDPESLQGQAGRSTAVRRFYEDAHAHAQLHNTQSIALIDPESYDAVFFAGGHGIMWDGVANKEVTRLVEGAYRAGRVVAAVCHGPAALLDATDGQGRPLVAGKQVTCLTNSEEELSKRAALVPFLLQDALTEKGAKFVRAVADMSPFAVSAGRIITGQNPASSRMVAELTVEALSFGVRLTP
ncbi:hypothetical protein WJX81_004046 [Elliptochloris bilobata]|uniref:DJ-1/PfpI domain-containing protein n=1 Tax=Elliptochloris bilobata TaxID=381761 RepID=A0AAW1S860_9CHLO